MNIVRQILLASMVLLPHCLNASVSVLPVCFGSYRTPGAILYYEKETPPFLEWSAVLFMDQATVPLRLTLFPGATKDEVLKKIAEYVGLNSEVYSHGPLCIYNTTFTPTYGKMLVSLQLLHDKTAEELEEYMKKEGRNQHIDPLIGDLIKKDWDAIVDTLNKLSENDKHAIKLSKTASPPLPKTPPVTTASTITPSTEPAPITTTATPATEDPEIIFFRPILNSLQFKDTKKTTSEHYSVFRSLDWTDLAKDWKTNTLYLVDKKIAATFTPEKRSKRPLIDSTGHDIFHSFVDILDPNKPLAGEYKTFKDIIIGHTDIVTWLLNTTGDKILIFNADTENDDAGSDTEWGVSEYRTTPDVSPSGKNYLGFMLMMLRDELRKKKTETRQALTKFNNDLRGLGNAVR